MKIIDSERMRVAETLKSPEHWEQNVENMLIEAKYHHDFFDKKIWPNTQNQGESSGIKTDNGVESPSYHNKNHIESTEGAVDAVFEGYVQGEDPFELNTVLDSWNTSKYIESDNDKVDIVDLRLALKMAFACHDLGNITKGDGVVQIKNDGRMDLDYADRYVATPVDTEERSAKIFEKMVTTLEVKTQEDVARLKRVEKLGKHLIMQTVFDFNQASSDEPGWKLVQMIDQIGGYSHIDTSQERSTAGLLNEMRMRGVVLDDLGSFLNFKESRFAKLEPDKAKRDDGGDQLIGFFEDLAVKEKAKNNA